MKLLKPLGLTEVRLFITIERTCFVGSTHEGGYDFIDKGWDKS
jgi:hypothetical protein